MAISLDDANKSLKKKTISLDEANAKLGGGSDAANSIISGAKQGVAQLAMLLPDTYNLGADLGGWITGNDPSSVKLPGSSDLLNAFGVEDYKPQTTSGRYLKSGISGGVSSLAGAPKQLAMLGASGLAGGVVGQAASDATDDNPWARMLGNLVGGGAVSIPWSMRNNAGSIAKDALKNLSPAQLDAADKLMKDAASLGTPITAAEAVAQVSGKNRLTDVQRVLEQSRKGSRFFEPIMSNRSQNNANAVSNTLSSISDVNGGVNVPVALKNAATSEMERLNKYRTAASSPYFKFVENDNVPASSVREIYNQLDPTQFANESEVQNIANNFRNRLASTEKPVRNSAPIDKTIDYNKDNIVDAVRKLGGINKQGLGGEWNDLNFANHPKFGPVWRNEGGLPFDNMARQLYEHGYIAADDVGQMWEKLLNSHMGTGAKDSEFSAFRDFNQADPLTNAIERLTSKLDAKTPAPRKFEPETNVGKLATTYREMAESLGRSKLDPRSVGSQAEGVITPINMKLKNLLETNPSWEQGNRVYEQITNDTIDPAWRSPVGQLAKVDGSPVDMMRQMRQIVMPEKPMGAVTPADITKTVKTLNMRDPNAAKDFTRTTLESMFNEADKQLVGGNNAYGGALFIKNVMGNKEQAANLEALIKSTGGTTAWSGFKKLSNVLEAQGKRAASGSQTASNTEILKELGAVPEVPTKGTVQEFFQGYNSKKLAIALTHPDGIAILKKMAMTGNNNLKQGALVQALISVANGAESDQ